MRLVMMKRVLWVALGLAVLFSLMLRTTPARAAGTFRIETKEVNENKKSKPTGDDVDDEFDKNGEWAVRVFIGLSGMPPTNQLVLRFAFLKVAVYDRVYMKEGDTPTVQTRNYSTGMPKNEDIAVPFSYLGKPVSQTKFELDLKRAAGFFEAGEYEVKLLGSDGQQIGQQQTLKLKGINKKDYRGTVGFETKVKSGVDAGAKTAKNDKTDEPAAAPTATDVAAQGSGGSMFGSGEKTQEEQTKDRPHACGCAIPGTESGAIAFAAPAFSVFALVFAGFRRARRRARA
jgi:hypothetical protein